MEIKIIEYGLACMCLTALTMLGPRCIYEVTKKVKEIIQTNFN